LIRSEAIVGLPEYQVTGIEESEGRVRIQARFTGAVRCPHCNSAGLRMKDRRIRRLRHESWGTRLTVLELETRKWLCRECKRSFWQRFPGILPRMRASEPFRRSVCQKHYDGTSRSRLGSREQISGATVERWFGDYLRHLAAQRATLVCPPILGIDEHFFTRKLGYATTFCDLKNHSIYDVVAGRSEAALESWLAKLEGKHLVKVVCMVCPPATARWCGNISLRPALWPIVSMSSGWSIITSWPAGKSWIRWVRSIADCCR
jgi:transposase